MSKVWSVIAWMAPNVKLGGRLDATAYIFGWVGISVLAGIAIGSITSSAAVQLVISLAFSFGGYLLYLRAWRKLRSGARGVRGRGMEQ